MWHAIMASTRASIWASVARLVVFPVLTTHTAHLLMLGTSWAIASHLIHIIATETGVRAARSPIIAAETVVRAARSPWTLVAAPAVHHPR